MNAAYARRTSQLQEADLYHSNPPFNQYAEVPAREAIGYDPSTIYASSLAAYPQYMPSLENLQSAYSTYPVSLNQQSQYAVSDPGQQQSHDTSAQLDPRLSNAEAGTKDINKRFIGHSSGLTLLADLLSATGLPPSTPWPHLGCDVFLRKMHSSSALASLPVPCRKTSNFLLETYHEIVTPLYPVYNIAELQGILENIYLNGIIAKRDIAECKSNCFALVIGEIIGILARQQPELDQVALDCANFARSGLAEVFLKPSLCGLRYLLCIILINHSRELPDPLWYTSGMAMQMCIDLNLHCETLTRSMQPDLTEEQLDERRRVFWTAYSIDRGLSMALGRPLTLTESSISCPFPKAVSKIALNRFKIRQLQSRIMRLHTLMDHSSDSKSAYPKPEEQALLHELNEWSNNKQGEEAIQGRNTELLLLRRAIIKKQSGPMSRAVEIIHLNIAAYRQEALSIALIEGILVMHDILVNLFTALYIFRFAPKHGDLDTQTLHHWIEQMRPIFQSLSRHWNTASESFHLVEHLFFRLQQDQS